MSFLHGFWINAALAVFFGVYSVAFLTGAAVADPIMAGLMALTLFFNCLTDALKDRLGERKGV